MPKATDLRNHSLLDERIKELSGFGPSRARGYEVIGHTAIGKEGPGTRSGGWRIAAFHQKESPRPIRRGLICWRCVIRERPPDAEHPLRVRQSRANCAEPRN